MVEHRRRRFGQNFSAIKGHFPPVRYFSILALTHLTGAASGAGPTTGAWSPPGRQPVRQFCQSFQSQLSSLVRGSYLEDRNPPWILVQIHTCDSSHALKNRLKDFNKPVIYLHYWTYGEPEPSQRKKRSRIWFPLRLCDPLWSSELPGTRDHSRLLVLVLFSCSPEPLLAASARERLKIYLRLCSPHWTRILPKEFGSIDLLLRARVALRSRENKTPFHWTQPTSTWRRGQRDTFMGSRIFESLKWICATGVFFWLNPVWYWSDSERLSWSIGTSRRVLCLIQCTENA